MLYYIDGGIIDDFYLTFSQEELIKNYCYDMSFKGGIDRERTVEFCEKLKVIETLVKKTVLKEEKEPPILLKYYGIPNFNSLDFTLCIVAKVENNGSTYIFSEDENFIKSLNDGYHEVKKA